MARRNDDDDDEDDDCGDIPPPGGVVRKPSRWDPADFAGQAQEVLDALEVTAIDEKARFELQRQISRRAFRHSVDPRRFPNDGRGDIIFALRCITESNGNADALIGPIMSAVVSLCTRHEAMAYGLKLIEAFDTIKLTEILAQLRSLDLLTEREIAEFLERAIRQRLAKILKPPKPEPVRKPSKREVREAAAARQAAANEHAITLGKRLLELRACTPNPEFGRLRNAQFNVDTQHGGQMMLVARVYGDRPDLWRASWGTLYALASPSLPVGARQKFEQRILAGGRVGLSEVRTACGKRRSGRPKAARPAA